MEVEQNNLSISPVLTIQSDWESFIQIPLKTVWVACKFRGETSKHGKVQGGSLLSDNPDFSVTVGKNSVTVKYQPTGHICRFIPAYKCFSKIHTKGILSLDASDGGLGVSSCRDGKLIVWDYATGEVKHTLSGHVGDVYKCSLFPSGIVVLSAGADTQIKIWSAETGQCPVTLTGHKRPVTDVAIIEKGKNILSVSKDGMAKLWHCGDSACVATVLTTTDQLNCCSLGNLPESAQTKKNSDVREIGTERKILVVGSEEGHIHGVFVSSREVVYSVSAEAAVNVIQYFSEEKFVAGTQDGRVLVYDLTSGSLLETIHESNSPVTSLAVFKDKGILVGRHDGTVTYYCLFSNTSDRLQLTGSDCEPITAICVTTSNIFTGCRDGVIRKYKVNDLVAGGV